MMKKNLVLIAVCALAVSGIVGCRVHITKDENGNEKNVQVDTPFGGVHVNTDKITATELGLPVYPGAQLYNSDDKNKSADVNVGFGKWKLRVRAVTYTTSDSSDKVQAFYKKALGRYGDVLTCKNQAPIGTPTKTSDGLTCSDDNNGKVNIDSKDLKISSSIQLKAGSKRHQHILGFEDAGPGKTRFSLVALDLPNDKSDKESD